VKARNKPSREGKRGRHGIRITPIDDHIDVTTCRYGRRPEYYGMFAARPSRFWLQIDENSIALLGRGFAVLIHSFSFLLGDPQWNAATDSNLFLHRGVVHG
jgi:hypothetical protein